MQINLSLTCSAKRDKINNVQQIQVEAPLYTAGYSHSYMVDDKMK